MPLLKKIFEACPLETLDSGETSMSSVFFPRTYGDFIDRVRVLSEKSIRDTSAVQFQDELLFKPRPPPVEYFALTFFFRKEGEK